GQFLDAIILPISDKDVIIRVNVNAPRHVKLGRTSAEFAPGRQELSVFGEDLDAVIKAVNKVEIIVFIECQTRRSCKLSRARALRAPGIQKIAIFIKGGNAVEPVIGDVDIALLVQCHRVGPQRPPRVSTVTAKFGMDFLFAWSPHIYLGDARAEVVFTTPADYIYDALGSHSDRTGLVKAIARCSATADRMTPIVDTPFCYCRKHLQLPHACGYRCLRAPTPLLVVCASRCTRRPPSAGTTQIASALPGA